MNRIRYRLCLGIAAAGMAAACASASSSPAPAAPSPRLALPACADSAVAGMVFAALAPTDRMQEIGELLVGVAGISAGRLTRVEGEPSLANWPQVRDVGWEVAGLARRRNLALEEPSYLLRADEGGAITNVHLLGNSGDDVVDERLLTIPAAMRLHPAIHGGCRVPVWFRYRLRFEIDEV